MDLFILLNAHLHFTMRHYFINIFGVLKSLLVANLPHQSGVLSRIKIRQSLSEMRGRSSFLIRGNSFLKKY